MNGESQSGRRFARRALGAVGLLALVASAACSANDATNDSKPQSEPLYGLGSFAAKWPQGYVSVCWQNPSDHPELQARLRGILRDTWERYANITFQGWVGCTGTDPKVTVAFSTATQYRGDTSHDGYGTPTVTLISDDDLPNLAHFRMEVIHEFGHALGFTHEQQRPDNFDGGVGLECPCPDDPGSDECKNNYNEQFGGILLTPTYDVDSIMNYCNPLYAKGEMPTDLSAGDVAGVQRLDAYGTPRARYRTGELVDPFFLGQVAGQPTGLRIHALLPTGTGAGLQFAYQDIASAYGTNDVTNWKVAGDLNGDARPDLVDTYFDGQNGAGQLNGLRIHAALSTGPGTWQFAYQDIAPSYGANDMGNWKVAGDMNGDNRPDLVDTYFLGQNGAGKANGLRVHAALSTGPGTWQFAYQDVAPAYGTNDMANWKVAGDLNGDHRPDLVDTYYLGQNAGQPRGLRIHTLLSTGPGTWQFTYQDIAADYGANDMGNWRVTGDLNGDGRNDLVDTFYLGQNGAGHANGLRVHAALSTGPGTWQFTYQDVAPAYATSDMANWKVADVNGDGRSDLVDVAFLGVGVGLRVHTLLSTGPGKWDYTFQDIAPGYGTNDVANWKVMDLDGDGMADLVDTYYLGQNGAGAANGLRVHRAISRGDGTWRFGYQDVSPAYGAADMANWKVAGLLDHRTQ